MFALINQEATGQGTRCHARIYRTFAELPADYHRLFDAMTQVNFCFSLPWFLAFAQTALQEDAAIRLYGVEAAGPEPRAHALLVDQTHAARRGSVLRSRHIGRHNLSGLPGHQTI